MPDRGRDFFTAQRWIPASLPGLDVVENIEFRWRVFAAATQDSRGVVRSRCDLGLAGVESQQYVHDAVDRRLPLLEVPPCLLYTSDAADE